MSKPETEPKQGSKQDPKSLATENWPKATEDRPIREPKSGRFVKGHPRLGPGKAVGSKHHTTSEIKSAIVDAIARKGGAKTPAKTDFARGLDGLSLERLIQLLATAVLPRPKQVDDTLTPAGKVERVTVTDLEFISVPPDMYVKGEKIRETERLVVEQRQEIAELRKTIERLVYPPDPPRPEPAQASLPPAVVSGRTHNMGRLGGLIEAREAAERAELGSLPPPPPPPEPAPARLAGRVSEPEFDAPAPRPRHRPFCLDQDPWKARGHGR